MPSSNVSGVIIEARGWQGSGTEAAASNLGGHLLLHLLWIVGGIVGLAYGSGLAVDGARSIASRFSVPSFVVGLTIASLGTSLPEVATNLSAAFHSSQGSDASGIAIGNVVGSCISQITLLLGITGLAAPMVLPRRMLTRDGSAALFAILALGLAALDGVVERWEGGLLVACYATYLWIVYRTEPRGAAADRSDEALGPVLLRGAAGLLVVLLAAQVIVDQGVELATQIGMTDTSIGLLVGVGTGLPELTVSLRAAMQKESALSLGNLLGSNVTDPLFSLGIGALAWPVQVRPMPFEFAFWVVSTVIALLLLRTKQELDRAESVVLIALFALFLFLRFWVL